MYEKMMEDSNLLPGQIAGLFFPRQARQSLIIQDLLNSPDLIPQQFRRLLLIKSADKITAGLNKRDRGPYRLADMTIGLIFDQSLHQAAAEDTRHRRQYIPRRSRTQVVLDNPELFPAERKTIVLVLQVKEYSAALVNGRWIGQRFPEHLVQQLLSPPCLHFVEQAMDGARAVLPQQVEVIDALSVCDKAHTFLVFVIFGLPCCNISRMPSLLIMTIPCLSSVIPSPSV